MMWNVRRCIVLVRPWTCHPATAVRYVTTTSPAASAPSVVCVESIQRRLLQLQSEMSKDLATNGYFTTTALFESNNDTTIQAMRHQAIALRKEGRFEPSWSEKSVESSTGAITTTRFDKEGVYACEPDGGDYDTAPDLLRYMTAIITYLPPILNRENTDLDLSNQAFNAKLAVTLPGGSVYPLHVDNTQGLSSQDVRKLTVILYLNPSYNEAQDGGALRLYLKENTILDLSPMGGRLVMFWSDEIPHEVLPTAPHAREHEETLHRYALTIWLPTDNYRTIHSETSPFKEIRQRVF